MSKADAIRLSGGCLCGGVRYRIDGECRQVVNCHCENCRRTHGHYAAYTAVDKSALTLLASASLTWYHDASPDTWRGFCNRCGASLFWDMRDERERISVAAGSLDDSRRLATVGHIFTAEAGSYYRIDDGLPTFEYESGGAFEDETAG